MLPNRGPLLRTVGRLRQVPALPRLRRGARFDRFTIPARGVLHRAQDEAQQLGHHWIGTEHLLLGLVGEEHGTAAQALKTLGAADLVDLRQNVASIIRDGQPARSNVSETRPPQHVGLTPRAKQVIELSVAKARRLNHQYVGTEHLLLVLLREGQESGASCSSGVAWAWSVPARRCCASSSSAAVSATELLRSHGRGRQRQRLASLVDQADRSGLPARASACILQRRPR